MKNKKEKIKKKKKKSLGTQFIYFIQLEEFVLHLSFSLWCVQSFGLPLAL